MKKIIIEDVIFDMFPETHIGVVVAKNINNNQVLDGIEFMLRESEKLAIENYGGKALLELPEMKVWREAYQKFGAKKGRRVSIEAVLKRVLKGDKLPSINPLVDIYNAISLRYVFPCGGEDLDAMSGDLRLCLADGMEPFKTIGSEENDPPKIGEVVYKDNDGCVCRCWNWREADRTKLSTDTKNAMLVIETLGSGRQNQLKEALDHLASLTSGLLGADTCINVLSRDNKEMILDIK